MYAPHTVTIYNIIHTVDPLTMEDTVELYGTVLHHVFFDAAKGVNVRKSGLVGADAVNLYIPCTVTASDVHTGTEKIFCRPGEYRLAKDKKNFWTLSVSGDGTDTLVLRGAVALESEGAVRVHDESYNLTSVDLKDYGRPNAWHWECGGA